MSNVLPTRAASLLLAVGVLLSSAEMACSQTIERIGNITAGPANRVPKFLQLGFTPDGKTLSAILDLQQPSRTCLVCYDTKTLEEVTRIEPKLLFNHFAYTPDGKSIVARSFVSTKKGDNELRHLVELRDAKTLEQRYALNLSRSEGIGALATPDGKTLVCPGKGHVLLVDLETGKPKAKFPAIGEYGDAVLSPDGELLALTNMRTERVAVYDLAKGRPVAEIPAEKEYPGWGDPKICFSPDSKTFARHDTWSGELRIYEARGGKLLSLNRTGANSTPALLRFTKDGKTVVYAAGPNCDPGVEAFSLERKEFVRPPHLKILWGASLAAVSADASLVAVARGGEAEIRLYRIDAPKPKDK